MDPIVIDMDALTWDDIEQAETIAGRPLMNDLRGAKTLTATALKALAVVFARKAGRDLSLAAVGALKVDEVTAVRTANPTPASD